MCVCVCRCRKRCFRISALRVSNRLPTINIPLHAALEMCRKMRSSSRFSAKEGAEQTDRVSTSLSTWLKRLGTAKDSFLLRPSIINAVASRLMFTPAPIDQHIPLRRKSLNSFSILYGTSPIINNDRFLSSPHLPSSSSSSSSSLLLFLPSCLAIDGSRRRRLLLESLRVCSAQNLSSVRRISPKRCFKVSSRGKCRRV